MMPRTAPNCAVYHHIGSARYLLRTLRTDQLGPGYQLRSFVSELGVSVLVDCCIFLEAAIRCRNLLMSIITKLATGFGKPNMESFQNSPLSSRPTFGRYITISATSQGLSILPSTLFTT